MPYPDISESFPFITLTPKDGGDLFFIRYDTIEFFKQSALFVTIFVGKEWWQIKESAEQLRAKIAEAKSFQMSWRPVSNHYAGPPISVSAPKRETETVVPQTAVRGSEPAKTEPDKEEQEQAAPTGNKRK